MGMVVVAFVGVETVGVGWRRRGEVAFVEVVGVEFFGVGWRRRGMETFVEIFGVDFFGVGWRRRGMVVVAFVGVGCGGGREREVG